MHPFELKSDGLNLQNLAKRSGVKTLRLSLCAREGYTLVAGDSSQIEARMGAWIAGETWLLDAFRRGDDPYSIMASDLYHAPAAEIYYYSKGEGVKKDPARARQFIMYRDTGKETILSSQYQIGGDKFSDRCHQKRLRLADTDELHKEEAKRIIAVYRAKNSRISNFWRVCNSVLVELMQGGEGYFGGPDGKLFYYTARHDVFGRKVPGIMFPNGYWLRYPNLRQEFDEKFNRWVIVYDQFAKGRSETKYIYGGSLFNNLTQGLAFAATQTQALAINRVHRIILNVHDEYMSAVPDCMVQKAVDLYNKCLTTAPHWCADVPFACEVGYGKRYGEV